MFPGGQKILFFTESSMFVGLLLTFFGVSGPFPHFIKPRGTFEEVAKTHCDKHGVYCVASNSGGHRSHASNVRQAMLVNPGIREVYVCLFTYISFISGVVEVCRYACGSQD